MENGERYVGCVEIIVDDNDNGDDDDNSMVLGPVVLNLSPKSNSSFSDFGFLKEGGSYSDFHSIRKKNSHSIQKVTFPRQ